jgi:hypothetical protein
MPSKCIAFRLKQPLYAKLEDLCRTSGHTPAEVMRCLLTMAVANPQPPFTLTGEPMLEHVSKGGRPPKDTSARRITTRPEV